MDFFDCVLVVRDNYGWSKWLAFAYLLILFLFFYKNRKRWPIRKRVLYIILGFLGLVLMLFLYFYLFPPFVCG